MLVVTVRRSNRVCLKGYKPHQLLVKQKLFHFDQSRARRECWMRILSFRNYARFAVTSCTISTADSRQHVRAEQHTCAHAMWHLRNAVRCTVRACAAGEKETT